MFSLNNFYKPAPAWAQRLAAALKSVGATLGAIGAAGVGPAKFLILGGLVVAGLGEALEKLTAAPPPAAAPDPQTDPSMDPADATT